VAATIVNHCSITVISPWLEPVVTPPAVEPITQLEIAALLSLRNRTEGGSCFE
jgi:hypothetical protein